MASNEQATSETCVTTSSSYSQRRGEAAIKTEFLRKNVDSTNKKPAEKEPEEEEKDPEGPQKKKAKLRGRNKRRPRDKRPSSESRLCPSIVREDECRFGDDCRFSHDVAAYVASKPPDVDSTCSTFERLGFCPYGIACRYGGQHLTADYKNVTDRDKVARLRQPQTTNLLSKEFQTILRKKTLETPDTDRFLTRVASVKKSGLSFDEWEATMKGKEESGSEASSLGVVTDEGLTRLRPCEKKTVDFRDKLYLAPLTTVGNLPFRRICKSFGADITCGEMAMCTNLLQGQQSEWALLRRHQCEDLFGVQVCGSFSNTMTRCAEMLRNNVEVDFVDVNVGCPIDLVYKKGGGCGLMQRVKPFEEIVRGMSTVLDVPLTVKMRTGVYSGQPNAHKIIPKLHSWGASLITIHGRSREQRYTRVADWDYIDRCAKLANPLPLFGNGDILSFEDANAARERTGVAGLMIARGALVKPWIFTEIKEQRHWDISSQERLDILKDFTKYGLEHWGSDDQGISTTRRFILEWLSFLHRYIPVGILEHLPQKINERPPPYEGRDELETLMASSNSADWVKISELLLGPVSPSFSFLPKHKANSYA